MQKLQRRIGSLLALCLLAGSTHAAAQQAGDDAATRAAAPATGADAASIPTLGKVRALPPELDDEEPLDLYRFRDPVQLEPNAFDRAWKPPPSVEEVSLAGGYIILGINYGLYRAGKGLHALAGGPDPVQPAIARPPPLSEAQARRAAMYCTDPDCGALPAGE